MLTLLPHSQWFAPGHALPNVLLHESPSAPSTEVQFQAAASVHHVGLGSAGGGGSAGGDGGRGKHPLLQTRTPAAGAPPSVEGQAQLHCMSWPTGFVSLRYTSSPPLTESGMQVPSAGRVPFGIPGGG